MPARIDAAIRSMRTAHGDVRFVQSETSMKGGLQLAVMADAIQSNPARDVSPLRSKKKSKGAPSPRGDDLRDLPLPSRARASEPAHQWRRAVVTPDGTVRFYEDYGSRWLAENGL